MVQTGGKREAAVAARGRYRKEAGTLERWVVRSAAVSRAGCYAAQRVHGPCPGKRGWAYLGGGAAQRVDQDRIVRVKPYGEREYYWIRPEAQVKSLLSARLRL